jgi:3-oxoacyl-[acyl-carrier protein] reductase
VAKSGLVGLTRSLAVELSAKNIQVNMVVPNMVETDLISAIPKMGLKTVVQKSPMKRLATPVDVSRAVVFLASSMSSYTTGQKIMVTGGEAPFL